MYGQYPNGGYPNGGYPNGGRPGDYQNGARPGGDPWQRQGGKVSRFFHAPECRPHRALYFAGNLLGIGFLGYLLLSTLFSMVLRGSPVIYDMYQNRPLYAYMLDIIYSILCVGLPFLIVAVFLRRTRFFRELSVPFGRPYQNSHALLLVCAGLGICFLGSLATNYFAAFAKSAGFDFYSYEQALEPDILPEGVIGVVVTVLRSALVPAIVEECVFRGVILQSLRRFGDWFAILSSAVLFGLMHANMTQVPFAIIAGIALGYVAVVSGSLRTGMAVHFLNNAVSVVTVAVQTYGGDGPALVASNVIIYGGIVLGVIGVAVFASKNRFALRLRPGAYGHVSAKPAILFLAPALLIAALWLLWYTLNDIVGFNEWILGLL